MTSNLDTLTKTAQAAQDALQAAQQAQAEAERQAADERRARLLAHDQATLDAYDPAALRAAVVSTYADVVAAVEKDNLPRAVRDHLAAIVREVRHGERADTAIANGAVPPDRVMTSSRNGPVLRRTEDHTGHDGVPALLGTGTDALADHAAKVTAQAIADAAHALAAAESAALGVARAAAADGKR